MVPGAKTSSGGFPAGSPLSQSPAGTTPGWQSRDEERDSERQAWTCQPGDAHAQHHPAEARAVHKDLGPRAEDSPPTPTHQPAHPEQHLKAGAGSKLPHLSV